MTEKQISIASGMLALKDSLKELFKDDWDEVAAPYRKLLEAQMNSTKDFNPLSAVIPIAKQMKSDGLNPSLMLAVAVDMSGSGNVKRS